MTKNISTFLFGPIETTWIVVDGTGEKKYNPKNIVSHYETDELVLPPDLEYAKQQIVQDKEKEEKVGIRHFWNGPRYRFKRLSISRTDDREDPKLDLWFGPSDYLNFLATNMRLDDEEVRRKYLQSNWTQPVEYFSNSFAIYLAVVTSDGYLITTHRGQNVMSRPGQFNVSFSEGLSRSLDHKDGVPDLYNCAVRGAKEELGIEFHEQEINLLSLGVDIHYSQWALLGIAKTDKTKDDIIRIRRLGVDDKWENIGIDFISFDVNPVVEYVMFSGNWAPGALACIYHSLVYDFGSQVREKFLKM